MLKKNKLKKRVALLCLLLSLTLLFGSCIMVPPGSDDTSSPPDSTLDPGETSAPADTTKEPEYNTTDAPETTTPPEVTTAPPEETTASPKDDPAVPKKRVAFTFDDGPNYLTTPKFLDKLEELNAKATFFVVGYNAEKLGKLIKRMTDMGCEVGNHSSGHEQFSTLSDTAIIENVANLNSIIETATGVKPCLLRPPYGEISKDMAVKLGMHVILWSVDPEDWRYKDAEKVAEHIISKVKDGDIVLLHDIYQTSYEAFCIAADALIADGFELVTVSELLGLDESSASSGIIHRSVNIKR